MGVSRRLRFRVFQRDRFTCVYCGRSAPAVILEADHKHPRSKGGPDTLANLVTACLDCNRGKSDRIVAAPVDSPPAVKTFPHPDTCSTCRVRDPGYRFYAALNERPDKSGNGHIASYQCDHGHVWSTYWDNGCRRTERQLFEIFQEEAACA